MTQFIIWLIRVLKGPRELVEEQDKRLIAVVQLSNLLIVVGSEGIMQRTNVWLIMSRVSHVVIRAISHVVVPNGRSLVLVHRPIHVCSILQVLPL
jgi:hypothetical protein